MKPTALAFVDNKKLGLALACLFLFAPAGLFAQRGAAGHAPAAHPVRPAQAPVVHAPPVLPVRPPTMGTRPVGVNPGVNPFITRPIMSPRPIGITPLTQFRSPLTMPNLVFPPRPPRRFPSFVPPANPFFVNPVLAARAWWAYNGLFPGTCAGFTVGYNCGVFPAYTYGVPVVGVPAVPDNSYPPQPDYSSAEPSATLQYAPVPGDYSSLAMPPVSGTFTGSVNGASANEVLLYLKDGTVFTVSSYTVSIGQIHYVTSFGEHGDVAIDQLDVQKTIDVNATRGVTFTLTPSQQPTGSALPSPAPAAPGPINRPRM